MNHVMRDALEAVGREFGAAPVLDDAGRGRHEVDGLPVNFQALPRTGTLCLFAPIGTRRGNDSHLLHEALQASGLAAYLGGEPYFALDAKSDRLFLMATVSHRALAAGTLGATLRRLVDAVRRERERLHDKVVPVGASGA